jgi:hypothetical protein
VTSTPLREDLRRGGWWLFVGGAAGGIAGLVVGGVGGRLLMLLLRLTSPEFVGSTSDDGFEIGVVTGQTLQLFGATMQIGALNGIGYVAARSFLRPSLRMPVWALVAGLLGASVLVHSDGVDFLLEPEWLAVGGFVLVPVVGAIAAVWLVERWGNAAPWQRTHSTVVCAVAAIPSIIGFALTLPLAFAALVLARIEPLRRLARGYGRFAAALLLAVMLAVSLANLVGDVRAIF